MTDVPTTTVSDVSGMLAVVPTLVGFQPSRAIVILFLDEPGRLQLTMRVDLDGANVNEVAATAVMAARRAKASELILVGYIPSISAVIREVLSDLAIIVENETLDSEQPLTVRQMAAVGRDGWCELTPWSREIPPLRPLVEISDHPVAVERIFAGMGVAASRQDLYARVQPGSDPVPDGFAVGLVAQREQMKELAGHEMASLLATLLDGVHESGALPDGETVGRIVALVRNGEARDQASLRLSAETSQRWIAFWSSVARCTTDDAAVVPLALVGLASWVRGDGAMSNIAVELAHAMDPTHPLAKIVVTVNGLAIPPETWGALVTAMQSAEELVGLDDERAS